MLTSLVKMRSQRSRAGPESNTTDVPIKTGHGATHREMSCNAEDRGRGDGSQQGQGHQKPPGQGDGRGMPLPPAPQRSPPWSWSSCLQKWETEDFTRGPRSVALRRQPRETDIIAARDAESVSGGKLPRWSPASNSPASARPAKCEGKLNTRSAMRPSPKHLFSETHWRTFHPWNKGANEKKKDGGLQEARKRTCNRQSGVPE